MENEYKIINPETLEGEPILEDLDDEEEIYFTTLVVDEDGLFDDDLEEKGIVEPKSDMNEAINPYVEAGYANRNEYLKGLAYEYNIPVHVVFDLASVLGKDEDFDALVTEIEDYAYSNSDEEPELDDEEDPRIADKGDKIEDTAGNYICKYYLDKYKNEVTSTMLFKVDDVVDFILEKVGLGYWVTVENYADNIIYYYTPDKYYVGIIKTSELLDEHPFD